MSGTKPVPVVADGIVSAVEQPRPRAESRLSFPTLASDVSLARVAGALYLVIIVCGVGSEALVRGPAVVASDAARTVQNLISAVTAFRLSILSDVVMVLCDVALAVLLFILFRPVDKILSLAAATFRLVQAAVLALNLLNLHHAIELATQLELGATRQAWVVHYLHAHAFGYDLGLFFFGVNCLATAALIIRSGWFSVPLGLLVGAAALVYLTGSTLHVVTPQLSAAFAPAYVVPLIAEVAFCAALLFRRAPFPAPQEQQATR